ncbi:metallophosphoesterase [Umezawaea sp. Da 62-37]|uniref:metallophosphoesterase n=1 Tax=Umezawaea sp. Da 62-37 TaxID=3075927 RepID=UPI0028F6E587|nr:metallophosphoesterase [Umezawaea sp. Da 62-37]WNV82137.1 metallophosphoesterase [Umezawaea sp. Da 62-37]
MRRGLLLVLVLALLFGVPWAALVAVGPDWPTAVVVVGTALFAVALVGFPFLMVRGHGRHHVDWASRISDITLGAVWVLFVWTLIGHVLRLVLALAGVENPDRARIVVVFVLVVTVALLVHGYVEAMRVPRIRTTEIVVPRLGRGLDGLRVVVITDTHYGPLERTKWSIGLAAAINELDADVVCHTGDLADGMVVQRRGQVDPLGTVRATEAKLYITGNHEYYNEAQGWLDHMETLGWEPMHNRHRVVERGGDRLVFAGIDDPTGTGSTLTGHGPDIEAALAGTDPDDPVVLLAHQPKQVPVAVRAGVDLQLSGHTHGGQIWPFHYLVRVDQPVLHGLSSHGERTQLYTSRGSGFWGPPFRVFAPSEISVLVLRSAR